MNREIKFRAWDKQYNIMVKSDQMLHIEFNKDGVSWIGGWVVDYDSEEDPIQAQCQINKEHLELMQFTGLKDKNGKEIYEGDIVKWTQPHDWEDIDRKDIVEWSEKNAGFYPFFSYSVVDNGNLNDNQIANSSLEYEVIGNIYENPELIK